jgi:hypothetical protein
VHSTLNAGALPTATGAGRVEPLSTERYAVRFTISEGVKRKLERARELLSHRLPSGDLSTLFEWALNELIGAVEKQRFGVGRRAAKGSASATRRGRYVSAAIRRAVYERDAGQCTFVAPDGRRCEQRRFLELEHRMPFALGGEATIENLCLLCRAHNQDAARRVFGSRWVDRAVRRKRQAQQC